MLVQYSKFLFTSFMAANKAILHIELLLRNDARDAIVATRFFFVNAAFHAAFLTRFKRKISDGKSSVKYGFVNESGIIYEARVKQNARCIADTHISINCRLRIRVHTENVISTATDRIIRARRFVRKTFRNSAAESMADQSVPLSRVDYKIIKKSNGCELKG